MLAIVSSPAQAIANIHKFSDELAESPQLQERLAYARAWYAHQDDAGSWSFAPSKFIGYQGIDAKTYIESADESDGRRTEVQLQMWFEVVDRAAPLHQELYSRLSSFLARYRKSPSVKTRINVLRGRRLSAGGHNASHEMDDAVVNLIVAVAKSLPTEHFLRLYDQLTDISG